MADADPTYELREQALKEQAAKGSKMIWVTFRKEGIHKYPAALDDPKLATPGEVANDSSCGIRVSAAPIN